MEMIPQIISTKDLSYLSDMFEWNYDAFKQINHYIGEVKDEQIKEILESIRNMHEDHLRFIISILRKEECDCEDCEYEDDEYNGQEDNEDEE